MWPPRLCKPATGICKSVQSAQALLKVATQFLTDIPNISKDICEKLAQHTAYVHMSVTKASKEYVLERSFKLKIIPCMQGIFVTAV